MQNRTVLAQERGRVCREGGSERPEPFSESDCAKRARVHVHRGARMEIHGTLETRRSRKSAAVEDECVRADGSMWSDGLPRNEWADLTREWTWRGGDNSSFELFERESPVPWKAMRVHGCSLPGWTPLVFQPIEDSCYHDQVAAQIVDHAGSIVPIRCPCTCHAKACRSPLAGRTMSRDRSRLWVK